MGYNSEDMLAANLTYSEGRVFPAASTTYAYVDLSPGEWAGGDTVETTSTGYFGTSIEAYSDLKKLGKIPLGGLTDGNGTVSYSAITDRPPGELHLLPNATLNPFDAAIFGKTKLKGFMLRSQETKAVGSYPADYPSYYGEINALIYEHSAMMHVCERCSLALFGNDASGPDGFFYGTSTGNDLPSPPINQVDFHSRPGQILRLVIMKSYSYTP